MALNVFVWPFEKNLEKTQTRKLTKIFKKVNITFLFVNNIRSYQILD